MKKLVLFSMLMGGFIAADAQNAPAHIPQQLKNKSVLVPTRQYNGTEVIGKLLREPNPYTAPSTLGLDPNEAIIGETTFDLQTNATVQNRLYKSPNGGLSAVWTYSQSNDLAATDRGTGYNYNGGGSWGASPTERIESKRVGWPSITTLANGKEYTITHNTADGQLQLTYRSSIGTGAWTEDITKLTSPIPTGNYWPRMISGGSDGNSLHVLSVTDPVANTGILLNGQDGAPCYSRSTDGGATWDKVNIVLPELDSTYYKGFTGDSYAWASHGDTIAFVLGDNFEDVILMKSTDNGDTWTKTTVFDFPYDKFVETTTLVLDTPNTSDGSFAIMLDNSGEAHVFWGAMRVLNDDLTDAQTSYFPFSDGVCYWNESMGAGTPADTIAFSLDVDNSGTLDFNTDASNPGLYYVSITGFPSVSLADNGDIYLTYSGLRELLDNGSQNYRHIYAIKSTDGGNTWSAPNDITPFEDFAENVFGSLTPTNDGNCVPLLYMRDFEPGLAARGDDDAFDVNEMVYLCIPSTLDVGVEEQHNIIDEFTVYPNPAGTSTKVSFTVNTAGNVVVNVYDVRGQLISSYSNKVPAGRSSLDINVENFASGVYFINAQIGADVKTQKLMVK